jgi:hypothetical protein
VELNAFSSDQLVKWLEAGLENAGIKKVVPDEETLVLAYKRGVRLARAKTALDEILAEDQDEIEIPPNLKDRVDDALDDDREQSWDQALNDIAADDFEELADDS